MPFAHPNGSQTTFPEITGLYNGRWRVVRRIEVRNQAQIVSAIFPAEATPDPAPTTAATAIFENLCLIDRRCIPGEKDGFVTLTYETLTNAFVDELPPRDDYELNGLKRTRRTLIALPGTSTADYIVSKQAYESESAFTAGAFVVGRRYKIVTVGTTDFTSIGASANTVGVVFTATGVGTGTGTARYPTQYLASVSIDANDAFTRILAEYLEPGIVSRGERLVDGGLKEVTIRSFYLPNAASPGIVVSQTQENENGYPIWISTTLQKADGTSPTSAGAALTHGAEVTFTYPGVASFYEVSITGGYNGLDYWLGDVDLSPPIESIVNATVTISYSSTSTFPAISPARWNPTSWAKLTAYWVTSGIEPTSKSQGLRGYRVGATATLTYPGGFDKASFFGQFVYGSSLATLAGGPANPSGSEYTLSYKVDPAFVDVDGTQYYRRTQVTATIP